MRKSIFQNRQLIIYLLIGTSAALVDLFFFLYFYRNLSVAPTAATMLSMFISMCYGFAMNIFYNFNVYDRLFSRFMSYAFVSVFGMILSTASLSLFAETLSLNAEAVKIVMLPLIALLQYTINRRISFSAVLQANKNIFKKQTYSHI